MFFSSRRVAGTPVPLGFPLSPSSAQGSPAGTYTTTPPCGRDRVDGPGAGARAGPPTDIGGAVPAAAPCAFALAMGGLYGPFLPAAPGGPAPPAGFIGDAVTEVPVIG